MKKIIILVGICILLFVNGCSINSECYEQIAKERCPEGYNLAGISGNVEYQCGSAKLQELYTQFADNQWKGNYTVERFNDESFKIFNENPNLIERFSFTDRMRCG